MSSRATRQLAQLWQLPLLLLSCILFALAGYLFLNASPGLTIRRRIDTARVYLDQQRPEAALQQLNRLLAGERLSQPDEAMVHLLIGKALESGQRQLKIDIPANYKRIIEQTQMALRMGLKPTGEICRRLGDSYEALGQFASAIDQFKHGMALAPQRALRLRRKVIEVEALKNDQAAVMASLDEYLQCKDLADAEKAWALGEKSQILADRGDFVGARNLIAQTMRLDSDPMVQGQCDYRMAYCAWKLHRLDEARKLALAARKQFNGQHPLDADAAFLLGEIAYARNDLAEARKFYQLIIKQYPRSRRWIEARLDAALCDVYDGNEDAGLSALTALARRVSAGSDDALRDQLAGALRQTSALMNGKLKYDQALAALEVEKNLSSSPGKELLTAIAGAARNGAQQSDASAAEATGAQKLRDQQHARDLYAQAARAELELARLTHSLEAFTAAVQMDRHAGNLADASGAMELFVTEHPDDAIAPDLLLQLGDCYLAEAANDKAITAYSRLEQKYPNAKAARAGAVDLARIDVAGGSPDYAAAERLLRPIVDASAKANIHDALMQQAQVQLANVDYRTGEYDKAIAIAEAALGAGLPSDLVPQTTFLAADSCRKCALQVEARVASAHSTGGDSELAAAVSRRKALLVKARGYYDRLIDLYSRTPASSQLDREYERQSYFHRGDCAYELGDFTEAIGLYQSAATHYQGQPPALAAYVQIANCYRAKGDMKQAKTADEKARAFLRTLPPEAFSNGSIAIPKAYWEQWTSSAGSP